MRLFIDESLPPEFAIRLNETGDHDAIHPLHVGRRGDPDHRVLAKCVAEDRVIVTQNARDFRRLVGREALHAGLIILPAGRKARSWSLLQTTLTFIAARGEPAMVMINQVVEVGADGVATLEPLAREP